VVVVTGTVVVVVVVGDGGWPPEFDGAVVVVVVVVAGGLMTIRFPVAETDAAHATITEADAIDITRVARVARRTLTIRRSRCVERWWRGFGGGIATQSLLRRTKPERRSD
jgi:hypothetical protein